MTTATADNSTLALNTIDYSHHEIHSGSSFFIREVDTLASGTAKTFVIITPNTTKWAHMILALEASGELQGTLTEGVTVVGGTAITVFNRNRNSLTAAGVILKHTPDSATGGTVLESVQVGEGRKIGGDSSSLEEIMLKQNTTYTVKMTNLAGADNIVNFLVSWYEHTDKY